MRFLNNYLMSNMYFLTVRYRYYFFFRLLCLALALALIFSIFSLADSSLATGENRVNPPMDKVLHAGIYGSIAVLIKFSGMVKRSVTVWFLVIGIGVLDELHQAMIIGRQSSVADLMADAVGVSLGIYIMYVLTKLIVVRHDAKF